MVEYPVGKRDNKIHFSRDSQGPSATLCGLTPKDVEFVLAIQLRGKGLEKCEECMDLYRKIHDPY